MPEFRNIAEFVAFSAGIGATIERADKEILEIAAQAIENEAKRVIGTYDYDWTPLSPATQADRVRQGFPADEPLLRTGELRDSIEHTIIDRHHAEIGSNSDIAVYQELGTAKIPPRSFLMQAAVHKEKEVRRIAGVLWHAALLPHALEAAIVRVAWDPLREFGESTRESFADMTNPDADNGSPTSDQIGHGAEHLIGQIMHAVKE